MSLIVSTNWKNLNPMMNKIVSCLKSLAGHHHSVPVDLRGIPRFQFAHWSPDRSVGGSEYHRCSCNWWLLVVRAR